MERTRPYAIPVLVPAFAALLLGISVAPYGGSARNFCATWWVWASWCTGVAVLAVFARRGGWGVEALRTWVYLGCIGIGLLRMSPPPDGPLPPGNTRVFITGQVADDPDWRISSFVFDARTNWYASFPLENVEVGWWNRAYTCTRVRCTLVASTPIGGVRRGDVIAVSGAWDRIPSAHNPGEFDQASFFARRGMTWKFVATDGLLTWRVPRLTPFMRLRRALDSLRRRFETVLAGPPRLAEEARLLHRMILGARSDIPPRIADAFQRTSTFHIIAISGLHIGIVGGLMWCVFWLAGVPGRYRALAALLPLWLYALMVGLRPSVLRAMFMFTAVAVAPLVNRPRNMAHTLLASAFVYMCIFPRQLTGFGTQLTFLSVAALVCGAPRVDLLLERIRWLRGPEIYDRAHRARHAFAFVLRYLAHLAAGTFLIWCVTWPVTTTRTHLLTPGTWLANLIAVPFVSLILACGCTAIVVSSFAGWLAAALTRCALEMLHALLVYITWISRMPGAHAAITSLTTGALLWYYVALVLAGVWLSRHLRHDGRTTWPRRALFAGAVAAFCVFLTRVADPPAWRDGLRVTTLDVGLGDACVIHMPGGETVLIDGGVRFGDWSMGERVVVPFLRAAGVDRVDAVICSHFDRDHIGGIRDVLSGVDVGGVYSPPQLAPDAYAEDCRVAADARGVPWYDLVAGDLLVYGSVTGLVVNPPATIRDWRDDAALAGDNTWSLVIFWEWRGCRILATGDATVISEALQRAEGYDLRADVMKAGHHGSATSSSAPYLRAVRPRVALVSVGANSMGLPSPRVLDRYRRAGARVLRTDTDGAIDIRCAPGALDVLTFRRTNVE